MPWGAAQASQGDGRPLPGRQQSGAQVVFVLEAADAQLNVIKQAKTQQYNPQWEVFSFNIQTQTLGNDSLTPPLLGTNLAPAYECHKYDGSYASYAEEIKTFVRDRHSAYAYPRLIEFVEDLPKTLTGKIRRIELRQREAEQIKAGREGSDG